MKKVLKLFVLLLYGLMFTDVSANPISKPCNKVWPFQKMMGTFDRAALQRGFQVFKEVCATCHSLKRIRFRELEALGFSEAEIKAIAASYTYKTLNNEGETVERKGEPSDSFPFPYENEAAGRAANGGALPPDLSLIVKARPNGVNYVYSLITGYGKTPPKDITVAEGRHYNPFMNGGQIAMAPPLTQDGQITYSDGTKATIDQMAQDIVTFLAWASEPEMEDRKRIGFAVMIYLIIMSGVFFFAMRKIWKAVK